MARTCNCKPHGGYCEECKQILKERVTPTSTKATPSQPAEIGEIEARIVGDITYARKYGKDKRDKGGIMSTEKQFLQDAAGLAQSEANRWESRDARTFQHWNQVAMLLRAEFLIAQAKPESPSAPSQPADISLAREFRAKWSHKPTPIPTDATGLWYSEECCDQMLAEYTRTIQDDNAGLYQANKRVRLDLTSLRAELEKTKQDRNAEHGKYRSEKTLRKAAESRSGELEAALRDAAVILQCVWDDRERIGTWSREKETLNKIKELIS